ncbi:MAG: type II secretion system protein [Candidatus Gracilibacteria bacterium]|nr:type II secretion system protein [Candidatus Gracilibacteria bacterium]
MKRTNKKAFTLVELLVVITILAIISVVAYQSFGGATDKAISSRKISDIATIESSLRNFKSTNNYYPMPMLSSATNMYGYDATSIALPTNKLVVGYNKAEITSITSATGGGKVMGSRALLTSQIGAKGTIGLDSNGDFNKKYLTKDLYDPELGDVTVTSDSSKMIDKGIGRYVYAVYATPNLPGSWNNSSASASYYNIATTIKDTAKDSYKSYIVGDFDKNSCATPTNCPDTLIGSSTNFVANNQTLTGTSADVNRQIPYLVKDF